MIVVADTGPLVTLDLVGQLPVLHALYGSVLVPRPVADELAAKPEAPGAGVATLPWVQVREADGTDPLVKLLATTLDAGEAAAIALAVQEKASLCLMDERAGRAAATRLGLRVKGTLGVLLQAKRSGHISEVRPLVARMREGGVHLSDFLVAEVLTAAGE